ncbi:MAG: hypothetical protein M0T72_08535 [Candidatus Dormibacteraeota bacterium]|nr:hypothetical protein [Candidatus Dormibacteraeota bacterium]
MLGIGIVSGLLGYGILYWGLQLWSGCTQNSLLDIMWPGGQRFTPCQPATSTGTGPPAKAHGTGGGPGGLLGQGTGNSLPPGTAPQLGGHS